MDENEEDGVLFPDPLDLTGRKAIATSCVADLGIEFPALIDPLDNRTEIAYTAWPERIYLVGVDGRIILKSAPGPYGFKPDDLEVELEKLFPDVPELAEEEIPEGDGGTGREPGVEVPPLLK